MIKTDGNGRFVLPSANVRMIHLFAASVRGAAAKRPHDAHHDGHVIFSHTTVCTVTNWTSRSSSKHKTAKRKGKTRNCAPAQWSLYEWACLRATAPRAHHRRRAAPGHTLAHRGALSTGPRRRRSSESSPRSTRNLENPELTLTHTCEARCRWQGKVWGAHSDVSAVNSH